MTEENAAAKSQVKMPGAGLPQRRRGIVGEFVEYLMENKKWWMIPIIVMVLFLTGLMVFGGSAIAPFIYTLF